MSPRAKPKKSPLPKTAPAKKKAAATPPGFAAKDISALSARIARDNARISRFMESLVNHVDLIVDAASAEDWPEVARQADYLAGSGATHGCGELADRAAELSKTLKDPGGAEIAKRQVIRLIGACGRVRQGEGR